MKRHLIARTPSFTKKVSFLLGNATTMFRRIYRSYPDIFYDITECVSEYFQYTYNLHNSYYYSGIDTGTYLRVDLFDSMRCNGLFNEAGFSSDMRRAVLFSIPVFKLTRKFRNRTIQAFYVSDKECKKEMYFSCLSFVTEILLKILYKRPDELQKFNEQYAGRILNGLSNFFCDFGEPGQVQFERVRVDYLMDIRS